MCRCAPFYTKTLSAICAGEQSVITAILIPNENKVMSVLLRQLEERLQPGMYVPKEFALLFKWIEMKGFYFDRPEYRIGYLAGNDQPGTLSCFCAEGSEWFPSEWGKDTLSRLCVFGSTGGEGSVAAFWIDDQGRQQIVHFGSGSGSTMACILVENAMDFLRLLAVGYLEVCWPEDYDDPPDYEDLEDEYGSGVVLEEEYKYWLVETFNVSIPKTGMEVVKSTSSFDDTNPDDEFCKWVLSRW